MSAGFRGWDSGVGTDGRNGPDAGAASASQLHPHLRADRFLAWDGSRLWWADPTSVRLDIENPGADHQKTGTEGDLTNDHGQQH